MSRLWSWLFFWKKQFSNDSGIYPTGNHVLVLPAEKEKVTAGGIIIPEKQSERYMYEQTFGTLVAVGPDAWSDFRGPWAKEGNRVVFAKYGGLQLRGSDKQMYRILNDLDIICVCDSDVDFGEKGYE